MRIKLSDYEEHIIKVKDVYEAEEFFEFVERLNYLAKMVKRDFLVGSSTSTPENVVEEGVKEKRTYRKLGNREWCDSKEKSVTILKLHYFGEKDKKAKFAKDVKQQSWNDVTKSFFGLKKRFNIRPQDIGLKYWPIIKGKHSSITQSAIDQAKIR